MIQRTRALALFGFLGVSFLAAGLGSLATGTSVDSWYAALDKPAFTPPSGLFGPVWTALYIAMALAGYLVWRDAGPVRARGALALWAVQLGLNAAWSPAFFGLQSPEAGLVVIVPLLVAIAATTIAFRRHSKAAAALFVPYLVWVSFATVLNAAIAAMN